MNRCPQCQTVFSEEYSYCLHDGTPLVSETPDEPTVVRSSREDETAALAGSPTADIGADRPAPGAAAARPAPTPAVAPMAPTPAPSDSFSRRSGAASREGVSPVFLYLAIGLLALVVIGAAVIWLGNDSSEANNASNRAAANANTGGLAANTNQNRERGGASSPSPRSGNANANAEPAAAGAQPRATEAPNGAEPAPAQGERAADREEPPPPSQVNEAEPEMPRHSTSRIRFGRGKVSQTVSGRIGESRSYLLYTLDGQSLSATVRSPGGCVTFAGGGTSTGFTTSTGDQSLRLENNCGRPAAFSMTVRVQ
jgi:hypothetical protein